MSCSPFEASQTQICVIGNCIFRIFKFHDGSLKMSHQTKVDKMLTCHSWATDNRIVAGSRDCKILVIESGELMLEMSYHIPHAGMGLPNPEISAITAFDAGFLLGLDSGVVVIFKKTEDAYYYKKTREITLEESPIATICLNIHDEIAVVTLRNSQIFKLTFEGDSQVFEINIVRRNQV